jgi:hypothetical protein
VELDWDGKPGTTTLRNCTLYGATVFSIWVENAQDRLDMVDCIVAGGENIGLAFEQATKPNYVGDHNLFQNGNPDRAITVGYVHEFGLSDLTSGAWTVYSGQDRSSIVAVESTSIFLSPDTADFQLTDGSPAIDAGQAEDAPREDLAGTFALKARAPTSALGSLTARHAKSLGVTRREGRKHCESENAGTSPPATACRYLPILVSAV